MLRGNIDEGIGIRRQPVTESLGDFICGFAQEINLCRQNHNQQKQDSDDGEQQIDHNIPLISDLFETTSGEDGQYRSDTRQVQD